MHCPGQKEADTEVAKGNNLADRAAFIMLLVPVLDLSQFDPEYWPADLEEAKC